MPTHSPCRDLDYARVLVQQQVGDVLDVGRQPQGAQVAGGVLAQGGAPALTANTIQQNTASCLQPPCTAVGGLHCIDSDVTLDGNVVENNTAAGDGPGVITVPDQQCVASSVCEWLQTSGNGYYCNGDTLVLCQNYQDVSQEVCVSGCVVAPPGNPDYCA